MGGNHEAPPGVTEGEEFVEVATETSKTKVGRCFSTVGQTKGEAQVPLSRYLREYWAACGMTITTRMEEGWRVERPDFSVVQIPLMGITRDAARMRTVQEWLGPGPRATKIEDVLDGMLHRLQHGTQIAALRGPVC